jgi:two-component system, OmpR family, KDP operon response regulator KdpE
MSTPRSSLLVVEDDPSLRKVLLTTLTASGFVVEEARSGDEALALMHEDRFDLVVLDINMPGLSGLEVCRQMRSRAPQLGIVMVTVRDAENDMVQALEAGADDYVTKPFRFRELTARVRAVLRRTQAENAADVHVLQAGNLELDLDRRLVRRGGEIVHLTPTEFDLLAFLMKNEGVPLTHAKLLRTIWGPEYGEELEYLRTYMRMLRKKIEDDPARPKYLFTEPWVGYRFCNPSNLALSTSQGE